MDGGVTGRVRFWLLGTVFASGMAVMIVEMTAVRAMQPFFGSTTYVWTNVIAVVLAALAVGYAVGGRLADRFPSTTLLYGLLGVGGGVLLVSAWLVTPVSRLFLQDGIDLEGAVTVLLRGSLGASLILFAPPLLLLGMIAPITIRLLARGGVGRAAGSVFAVSTVGSILGTYLPALVLVPRIGSRGSILVAAALLLVVAASGLLIFRGRGRRIGLPAVFLVVVGLYGASTALRGGIPPGRGAPALVEGGQAEVLCEVESPYQYLTVRRDTYPEAAEQVLTINEGTYTYHSVRVLGRVLTGSRYYDTYALIPFLLDLDPGTELRGAVLGLACGVNVGQWKHFWSPVHRLKIDGAELDPEVVVLGRTYFDLPGPEASWLRTVVMDGRQMLEALPTEHRYHVLVVDAFTNELYVPFHLATREFFELCRRRMEPGAILAMNVYARGEEAPNLRAIENTLATVFGRCLRLRLYDEGGFLLLARRGAGEIELARLDAQHIQERFDPWEGFAAWSMIPEWDDLLRLAAETRDAGATGSVREILPAAEAIVLTDDHAPLAWLTDRFLGELEEVGLAGDDERGLALRSLIARQGRTLWIVGLVWSGFLAFGFVLLHRSMPAATACAGTTTRPCRPRRR